MPKIGNLSFAEWLDIELKHRAMSQAELARQAGVTRAAITNILTSNRGPGVELCQGIARAFKIPPEEVFRAAGLLPQESKQSTYLERMIYLFNQLDDETAEDYLAELEFKIERRRKKKRQRGKNNARQYDVPDG